MTDSNLHPSSSPEPNQNSKRSETSSDSGRRSLITIIIIAVLLAGAFTAYTFYKAGRMAPELRELGWLAMDAPDMKALPWVWTEDGVPKQPRQPWRLTPKEEAALAAAEARIPALRMGEARLTLLDESGSPLPAGTRVEFALINHEFLFGMDDWALPHIDQVRRRLKVNASWTGSPWRELQSGSKRAYDFRYPEHLYAREWRQAAGFTTILHPVVWLIKTKYDGAQMHSRIPEFFFYDVRPSQQKDAILAHVRTMAEYSRSRYDIVNLINEPVNDWANPMDWDWRGEMLPFFAETFQEFRKINPDAQLMINLAGPFMKDAVVPGEELVQYLVDHGARPDWIGLEIWANGTFPWNLPMGYLSVEQIAEGLADYQRFGIPIYLSEFATPNAGSPYGKWEWTDERQEIYVRAIMTLAFGTEGVGGINYYLTYDEFMENAGLLDENSQPRAILGVLESMIGNWTTEGEAAAGEGGRVDIKGYGGDYAITARDPASGREWRYAVAIKAQSSADVTLLPEPAREVVAPEYAGLGPDVRPEHIMDVSLEPIAATDLGQNPHVGGFVHLNDFSLYSELEREEGGVFVVKESRGFIPANLPEEGGVFTCDLDVKAPEGVMETLQVISGSRRWYVDDVTNGAHRLTFDVRPGEQPCVYTVLGSQGARVRVVAPRLLAPGE